MTLLLTLTSTCRRSSLPVLHHNPSSARTSTYAFRRHLLPSQHLLRPSPPTPGANPFVLRPLPLRLALRRARQLRLEASCHKRNGWRSRRSLVTRARCMSRIAMTMMEGGEGLTARTRREATGLRRRVGELHHYHQQSQHQLTRSSHERLFRLFHEPHQRRRAGHSRTARARTLPLQHPPTSSSSPRRLPSSCLPSIDSSRASHLARRPNRPAALASVKVRSSQPLQSLACDGYV